MVEPLVYFIHVPRTAGTFLTRFLTEKLGDRFVREGHTVPPGVLRPWTERFGPEHYRTVKKEDCLTISVVRNPFDLLVSMYVWGFPYWPPKNFAGAGQINWPFVSFRDYVRKLTDRDGYPWIVPEQKASLFFQLYDADGRLIPDQILRQEHLVDDVRRLGEILGERWTVPNEKINQTSTPPTAEFYDDELVDRVSTSFDGDLRAFGYDFACANRASGEQADVNYHRLDDAFLATVSGRSLLGEGARRMGRRMAKLMRHRV